MLVLVKSTQAVSAPLGVAESRAGPREEEDVPTDGEKLALGRGEQGVLAWSRPPPPGTRSQW